MFNSASKKYTVYKPQGTTDRYNQEISTYIESGSAVLFLSLNTHAFNTKNDISVTQCEYIATTFSTLPQIGDLIDNKYEVRFIVEAGRERFLYLKEYQHG